MQTTIATKNLPSALRNALASLAYTARDVTIEARERAVPSTYTNLAYTSANVLVENLDNPARNVARRGVFGGDNGFNRAPLDRAWDPDFDRDARNVPLGGAIVVGHIGKSARVYVHPTTYAERFVAHDVVRDAILERRLDDASVIASEASALTDEECAILFVHTCWKSGDGRKRAVNTYASALESCVARGLIKRASNGACSVTTAGKALRDVWYKRGGDLAWKAR